MVKWVSGWSRSLQLQDRGYWDQVVGWGVGSGWGAWMGGWVGGCMGGWVDRSVGGVGGGIGQGILGPRGGLGNG